MFVSLLVCFHMSVRIGACSLCNEKILISRTACFIVIIVITVFVLPNSQHGWTCTATKCCTSFYRTLNCSELFSHSRKRLLLSVWKRTDMTLTSAFVTWLNCVGSLGHKCYDHGFCFSWYDMSLAVMLEYAQYTEVHKIECVSFVIELHTGF